MPSERRCASGFARPLLVHRRCCSPRRPDATCGLYTRLLVNRLRRNGREGAQPEQETASARLKQKTSPGLALSPARNDWYCRNAPRYRADRYSFAMRPTPIGDRVFLTELRAIEQWFLTAARGSGSITDCNKSAASIERRCSVGIPAVRLSSLICVSAAAESWSNRRSVVSIIAQIPVMFLLGEMGAGLSLKLGAVRLIVCCLLRSDCCNSMYQFMMLFGLCIITAKFLSIFL